MEHLRAAKNPTSYAENAVGKHYSTAHSGQEPNLEFHIIDRQKDSVKRKISEAFHIIRDKPVMNDRTELRDLIKFTV